MHRRSRRWRTAGLGALLLFARPAGAQAHGAIPGLEGIVSGFVHPLTIPAHVLLILSLGLLLGQQQPLSLKKPFLVFLPCLAAALLFTLTKSITGIYQPVLITLALATAVLVAIQRPLSLRIISILLAAAGVVIGLDSGPDIGTVAMVFKTIFGTCVMVVFLVFDLAYYTSFAMRREWTKVGVRILGSWIIAISMLVLAFALKKS